MHLAFTRTLFGTAAVAAALTYTDIASAELIVKDASSHERHSRLDFTGLLDPLGVFNAGFGGSIYLPIVPDGFIPSLNDTFGLEFGAVLIYSTDTANYVLVDYDHSWWNFAPLGGVRWDFHLTPSIQVFAKFKLGYAIGFHETVTSNGETTDVVRNNSPAFDPISYFVVDAGIGAYFHLNDRIAIRAEAGSFSLIAAGISIAL